MTLKAFDILVGKLEKRFRGRPRALRLCLALFAILGYAGFLVWFCLVFALGALFFVPALHMDFADGFFLLLIGSVVVTAGFFGVARVLWVRVEPPQGRLLTRTEAPAFFEMLDQIRGQLKSARFHKVLITQHCNAAVCEIPRLGVLGWPRNYLFVGLPLLQIFSVAELRAVLAHEAAHLSARHGRFSSWMYRLRRSWETVFSQIERPGRSRRLFSFRPLILKFIRWFWPRFNAYAFVLSRSNEFEADAVSAQIAGPQAAAQALWRSELGARFLSENFWPSVWREATTRAEPPDDVFGHMHQALFDGAPDEEMHRWQEEAFRVSTDNRDTHPCLRERLEMLSVDPADGPVDSALCPAQSAGEALLGEALPTIQQDIQREWIADVAKTWRDRNNQTGLLKERLNRFSKTGNGSSATAEVLWERAQTMMNLEGDEAAEGTLRELLVKRPQHAGANFCLGRFLLDKGDPEGEALLERVIESNEESAPDVFEQLHVYFQRTGRADKLAELRNRVYQYEEAAAAAQIERSSITPRDRLLPHGLTDEELVSLREVLLKEPDIACADLVQKELQHSLRQRVFVLSINRDRKLKGISKETASDEMVQQLIPRVVLPGRVFVVARIGSFRRLAKRAAGVQGARVYTREG